MHVREDRRELIHPTVISHGFNAPVRNKSRFHLEFDWLGTNDPSAILSVQSALESLRKLQSSDWSSIMRNNRELAARGRELVCDALQIESPVPQSMLGSMASIPVRESSSHHPVGPFDTDPLQRKLYERYRIEVPVFPFPNHPHRMLRLSAHVYNDLSDYECLADALAQLMAEEST